MIGSCSYVYIPDCVVEGNDEAQHGGGEHEVAVLHGGPLHVQLVRTHVPPPEGEQGATAGEHVLKASAKPAKTEFRTLSTWIFIKS